MFIFVMCFASVVQVVSLLFNYVCRLCVVVWLLACWLDDVVELCF